MSIVGMNYPVDFPLGELDKNAELSNGSCRAFARFRFVRYVLAPDFYGHREWKIMTYLNFLILFVVIPAMVLGIAFRKRLTRRWWAYIALLVIIAVVWTTPWDNYLVATRVWWYNPNLVLGIVFGYVPLEEYSFFVLQTVLTGILLAGLSHRFKVGKAPRMSLFARVLPALLLIGLTLLMLSSGDPRYNYLILILGWLAFFPLLMQWGFGLDILLARWPLLLTGILLPTLWLTAMDSIAIGAGTWTIDPAQTVSILLPGGVPLEEGVFFLMTNTLIVQGILLVSAPEAKTRLEPIRTRLFGGPRSEFSQG
jgi:lycopene cyclase domain-containing protein